METTTSTTGAAGPRAGTGRSMRAARGAAPAWPASRSSLSSSSTADHRASRRRPPSAVDVGGGLGRSLASRPAAGGAAPRGSAALVAQQAGVGAVGHDPAVVDQHHPLGQGDGGRPVGDDDRGAARASPRPGRRGSRAPWWGRPPRWRRRGSARGGRRGSPGRWRCAGAGRPTARSPARRSRCRSRRAGSLMNSWAPARRAARSIGSIGGVGVGEGDVGGDGVGEQERLLEHQADGAAQLARAPSVADVDRRRGAPRRRRRRRSGAAAWPRWTCRCRWPRPGPPTGRPGSCRSNPSSTGRRRPP